MAGDILADLDVWRESRHGTVGEDDAAYRLFASVDEFVDSLTDPEDRWALVPDPRPLHGAYSPAGPDVGRSTTMPEVAGDLARRAREAAEHPWWQAYPHAVYPCDDLDDVDDLAA